MKKSLSGTIAALLAAAPSYAAAGPQGEHSLLMTLFFGFAAVIIVFQLVPAGMLLAGMVKGVFSAKSAPAESKRS